MQHTESSRVKPSGKMVNVGIYLVSKRHVLAWSTVGLEVFWLP